MKKLSSRTTLVAPNTSGSGQEGNIVQISGQWSHILVWQVYLPLFIKLLEGSLTLKNHVYLEDLAEPRKL